MKKNAPLRPVSSRPNPAKTVVAATTSNFQQDPADLACDGLLTEMRHLDDEYVARLQQTLTAGQYNRFQGEPQQRMARFRNFTRR